MGPNMSKQICGGLGGTLTKEGCTSLPGGLGGMDVEMFDGAMSRRSGADLSSNLVQCPWPLRNATSS